MELDSCGIPQLSVTIQNGHCVRWTDLLRIKELRGVAQLEQDRISIRDNGDDDDNDDGSGRGGSDDDDSIWIKICVPFCALPSGTYGEHFPPIHLSSESDFPWK